MKKLILGCSKPLNKNDIQTSVLQRSCHLDLSCMTQENDLLLEGVGLSGFDRNTGDCMLFLEKCSASCVYQCTFLVLWGLVNSSCV